MNQQIDEEMMIRHYLLGGLDEGRQAQVDERLLCDDDFAERFYAAQDNLIDDYVFNLLIEEERASFEKNFIFTGERRQKLLFAQTMENYVSKNYPRPRGFAHAASLWWRNLLPSLSKHKVWAATAFATGLLLIVFTLKLVGWFKPNAQDTLSQRRASIEHQLAELNTQPFNANAQALPTLELSLQPSLLREGDEMKKADLVQDLKLLSLKLWLPQVRYQNYRALVRTVEGNELFAIEALKPQAGAAEILLKIPTEFLPTDDYQIELKGVADNGQAEDVARYNFRVRR